jgi:hypothetical protein
MQPDPKEFAAGDYNLYRYCHNDPVNHADPTGLWIDTVADIGFIAYDAYKLFTEGGGQGGENWKALGLDAAGAAIPVATGLGAAYRAGKATERAIQATKCIEKTNEGSRVVNKVADLSRANFEKNLTNSGWTRSVSKDGRVVNYEKDGARYSVRDNAKSTGGPTADYYKAGSDKPDIKIRLKKDQ